MRRIKHRQLRRKIRIRYKREKNSLPKTGDKALGLASILGGTLVLLAGVILFRRKKA
ncbi:LPXTG cell wall anchor domain-containing protein [Listeria fleischmannii]|uniref:LPXTG cell wall anchor domain-containing protein n=1 Tax=Listeria fleischmannii TaxID=1069827 RepID=UPI00345F04C5